MRSMLDLLNAFNNTNKKQQQNTQTPEQIQAAKDAQDDRKKKIEQAKIKEAEEAALKRIEEQKEAERKRLEELQRLEAERKENERPKVSFVMTACGRPDLMEKTLDSFFKFNKYPIEKYIITEDSMDPEVFEECKRLNAEKYNNQLEFIFNNVKLGQARSIDLAYSKIETEYVFHCEEDWEFYKGEFIEKSLKVLSNDEQVLQAWIRPKSDKILNDISSSIIAKIGGISVRQVLPKSFMVKGGMPNGTDLIVRDYMGFSWNPGLKRMSDYKLLSKGYSSFKAEHLIDGFYRSHPKKFKVVSISENDEDGYVKHIGWGRRADNPIYNEDQNPIKDLEQVMLEAKKKREEDKLRMESIEAAKAANDKPKVLTPKISVIMQVYLGDYPGARTDSVLKFHRAVKSFLDQKYNKAELIIVSDGCKIVEQNYYDYYANKENIKYAYVDKTGLPNMYESLIGGNKYYRGIPRQVGNAMAEGSLITYMDSDDFLHPEFLYRIVVAHNHQPNAKWLMNDTWLDHEQVMSIPLIDAVETYVGKPLLNIPFLGAKFVQTKVKEGLIVNTPWLLTHVAETTTKWRDTIDGTSEDVDFGRRLREEFKNSSYHRFSAPTYIRCHYTNLWDV